MLATAFIIQLLSLSSSAAVSYSTAHVCNTHTRTHTHTHTLADSVEALSSTTAKREIRTGMEDTQF